jgi:hypothetical protein
MNTVLGRSLIAGVAAGLGFSLPGRIVAGLVVVCLVAWGARLAWRYAVRGDFS